MWTPSSHSKENIHTNSLPGTIPEETRHKTIPDGETSVGEERGIGVERDAVPYVVPTADAMTRREDQFKPDGHTNKGSHDLIR